MKLFQVIGFLIVYTWICACGVVNANSNEGDVICFNIFLFSNNTLAGCQLEFSQYLSRVETAGTFCSGGCAQPLAQAYQDCGYYTAANQIITECAQDTMGRYCGDMLRNETFSRSVEAITDAGTCSTVSGCSGECQSAIENVGCCLSFAPNITESELPVDMCNFDGCSRIKINIPATNPQSCFSAMVAADSVLTQCFQDFISAAVMAMGNPAPTREFCSGTMCPSELARTYATCGLSAHSTLVQKGCSLDGMDRYCGNVVDRLITPQWTEMVTAATTACAGTDCTNSTCQTSINNLGCCIALGVEVTGAQLPLAQCNVDYCPATFTLDDGATTIHSLSVVMATLLLVVAYFVV